jgi:hypothetical protein
MHTLCNAYWLDNDSSDECDIPIIKDTFYGFNQNPEIVATLPPSPLDNFCGAAKHNSSPNTYSIDSAALISDNEDCGTGKTSELAAKAEAERLAEEERSKYASCENLSEELNERAFGGRPGAARDGYLDGKGNFIIKAHFIPNEMFVPEVNSYGDVWFERGSMGDWFSHTKVDPRIDPSWQNPKSKGWCVWRDPNGGPSPSVIMRRPGCTMGDKPIRTANGKWLDTSKRCSSKHMLTNVMGHSPRGLTNHPIGKGIVRGLKCTGKIEKIFSHKVGWPSYQTFYRWEWVNPDEESYNRHKLGSPWANIANPDRLSCP